MGNVTDNTYYQKGKKFIPNNNNLNTEISGVPNNGSELDYFIAKYERELLIGALNITLYNELNTALDDLTNADVKWQNLVNGVEYVKDDVTYRFDGLRGFQTDSLVAFYVFCKYLENDESYYSTTGTVVSKSANSMNFSPTTKYNDAWYNFLDKYQNGQHKQDDYSYIVDCDTGLPVGVDYYHQETNSLLVSLETYLKDHEADFEGYNFTRYSGTNHLGI
jgi:hypothetical protein